MRSILEKISAWLMQLTNRGVSESQGTYEESLEQLNRLAKRMTSEERWLNQTDPLSESEFALIGELVQVYCVADFNARRVVNGLRAISRGEERDFAAALNETDVLLHLQKSAASWTGAADVRDGVVRAARTLEMHRIHRHNFAHWIVRRLRGENALVILTMNAPEAEKRDGKPQEAHHAKWGMVQIAGLRKEMVKLKGHSVYLAKLAVHLEENRDRLRQEQLARSA